MYKIRKITFEDHPVLGNLSLDFCDSSGKAVDTVILAGENGTGKSTVLEELFSIVGQGSYCHYSIEVEQIENSSSAILKSKYSQDKDGEFRILEDGKQDRHMFFRAVFSNHVLKGIFLCANTPTDLHVVRSITSMSLDKMDRNQRTDAKTADVIKQLFIDIQSQDDSVVAHAARLNGMLSKEEFNRIDKKMDRFSRAFDRMFPDLKFDRIEFKENEIDVVFKKGDSDVPLYQLSSGEQQIVFRGGFLLKDINATKGAVVFIDEPENSLHPTWQMKIMDFFKGLLTDANGTQTSQIFVATHSPFIIHNPTRHNDKIIVLKRAPDGRIVTVDRPEFYCCSSMEPIQEAFSIGELSDDTNTVYVEGRTDEKYFNRAMEVFKFRKLPVRFKWIGHLEKNGHEAFSGSSALTHAIGFLRGSPPRTSVVFLYDCDTNRQEFSNGNLFVRVMPYHPDNLMNKGIENAICWNGFDCDRFYTVSKKKGDNREETTCKKLDKMSLCEAVCSLPEPRLVTMFAHLKNEIFRLARCFGVSLDDVS